MNIKVTRRGKKIVADFADKYGMKEVNVASRLYEWFASQPEPVQKWVAGLANGHEGAGMAMFAKQLLDALGLDVRKGARKPAKADEPIKILLDPTTD